MQRTQKSTYRPKPNSGTVPKKPVQQPEQTRSIEAEDIVLINHDDDSASVTGEEENDLHDKLDTCTVEQLRELQKQSMQFDQQKNPQHRIDAVTEEIRGMGQRATLRFDAPLDKLTPQEIVARFDRFLDDDKAPKNKQPLLLNMERHSPHHKRLLQWDQYEQNGDFFDYIHLALFDTVKRRPSAPVASLGTLPALQHAFIASHHQATPFKSAHLIEQLEIYLTSKLLDIYINRRTASFLFELNEASQFILVVCFGLIFVPPSSDDPSSLIEGKHIDIVGESYKEWGDEIVSLTRDDLFIDAADTVNTLDDGSEPSPLFTKRKKAQKLDELAQQEQEDTGAPVINMKQRREYLRLSKLSYLYYGYMWRV
jgi:hypothetical protein